MTAPNLSPTVYRDPQAAPRPSSFPIIQPSAPLGLDLSEQDRFESALIAVQGGRTDVVRDFLDHLSLESKGELLASALREGRDNQLAISHLLIQAGAPATEAQRSMVISRALFDQHFDIVIDVLREANNRLRISVVQHALDRNFEDLFNASMRLIENDASLSDDLCEDLIDRLTRFRRLSDIRNLLANASIDLRITVLRDAFSNRDLELMKAAFFVNLVAEDFAQIGFGLSQAISRKLFRR